MRLLPALLLSLAVHATVLAMATQPPATEGARLEVSVRLEASGQDAASADRASRSESVPLAAEPQQTPASMPTAPPHSLEDAPADAPAQKAPREFVADVPAAEPETHQAPAKTVQPAKPQVPEPVRTASAQLEPLEPTRDHARLEVPAKAAPPSTSAKSILPRKTPTQSAPASTAAASEAVAQTDEEPSSRELVAALARSLAEENAASAVRDEAPGRTAAPVQFGSDEGPKFLKRADIEYPGGARRADRQGRVVLRLELDKRGTLLRAEIAESAGPRLDRAALRFARASTYTPAARDGRPVACTALLPITFNLTR